MKKTRHTLVCIVVITMIIAMSGCMLFKKNEDESVEQYYGQWKVTEYIPLNRAVVEQTIWQEEHYLGRTVEITENNISKSIYYWPDELEEHLISYDFCEVADIEKDDTWITQNAETLRWLEGEYFNDSTIKILKFFQEGEEEFPETYCAVTRDNQHLIVSWLSGEYLLEKFDTQNNEISLEDIFGEWKIDRLDSYDSTYEGQIKDVEYIPEYRTEHLKLSEFYAPDWFSQSVNVTEDELKIGANINGKITSIQSQVVNKDQFEKQQGIHDGLSLNNEELSVWQIYYGDGNDVLTVVPVNKNKMIAHIEMGWFVLTK